jgi:hypothetical protein
MIGRVALCVLAWMLLSVVAAAQGTVKVIVSPEDNKPSKDVADILQGKIGSTLRYALTTDVKEALILVDVLCVDVTINQFACTAPTLYYPAKFNGLSGRLLTSLAIGSSAYVADVLFNSFVGASSDEKLKAIDQTITAETLSMWFEAYKEGYEAGQKAAQKPPAAPKKN